MIFSNTPLFVLLAQITNTHSVHLPLVGVLWS